jgi:DNA-binding response OmpR family regulator
MRVLHIATRGRKSSWLAEAFAADSASQIALEETIGAAAGMARLREEVFDIVLVSHDPGELDALDLIEGYRAGGAEEPIVVLGGQSEQEVAALCYEVGADGYLCIHTATTRNLIWIAARAVQRHELLHMNHQLVQAEQARLDRERDEARELIAQQRHMVGESDPVRMPEQLVDHYRELLRTYIIMGSGNLSEELKRLAEMFVGAGMTAGGIMQLHLLVAEELVHGLGTRSTRHVMGRANLLVLELMTLVAGGYQQRYQQRIHPPIQQTLPGFE